MGKISKGIIDEYRKRKLSKIINLSEIQLAKKKLAEINKDLDKRRNIIF